MFGTTVNTKKCFTVQWLDTWEHEVWYGDFDKILQYAKEEKRPYYITESEGEEVEEARPFLWGYRIPERKRREVARLV